MYLLNVLYVFIIYHSMRSQFDLFSWGLRVVGSGCSGGSRSLRIIIIIIILCANDQFNNMRRGLTGRWWDGTTLIVYYSGEDGGGAVLLSRRNNINDRIPYPCRPMSPQPLYTRQSFCAFFSSCGGPEKAIGFNRLGLMCLVFNVFIRI